MKRVLLLFWALWVALPVKAADQTYVAFFGSVGNFLVAGYRLPVASDMKYYWNMKDGYPYRSKDGGGNYKAPFWTSGDFNQDGKVDYAYILVGRTRGEKQLFAFLSGSDRYVAVKLGEPTDEEMGVATQEPGRLQTASGKGYWGATAADPAEVVLASQVIAYFAFEGAGEIFVWDKKSGSFREHWLSD